MGHEFAGRIGRDWRESEPWWPPEPTAPAGAPNVVMVVLDDVGFAQLGCYGSDIETPVIDALASEGVRLANFHTTSLCSPTRVCLLSGRNHHRSAMGRVADLAVGFPGYWGKPPRENGFLSEILRENGYATYAVGKWHLTPEDETNMAASRATWPLARGFDRWYGFHGGETHQFVPALYHDNHSVRPPASAHDGYHLSEDLLDHALTFLGDLRAVDAERPFFLYLAFGACHSPHQPPAHWREHYRGRFDAGWDEWRQSTFERQVASGLVAPTTKLSERPSWVRPWDELDEGQRRVAARFMEAYAGFLSHADQQVGRLLDFLEHLGERDNTIVVVVSDNGASAEGGSEGSINDVRLTNLDPAGDAEMLARIDEIGGPLTHNNYPWGWTMAGNTPFRRWKREVHEGGVADPCIVVWPDGGLAANQIRHQFTHAIDVVATVLELGNLRTPTAIDGVTQSALDGTSFAYLLGEHGAAAPERHETQYFEMFGSRAIYHRGWKAVTFHPVGPLYDDQDPNASFDDDVWELYRVSEDIAETRDLAREYPDVLSSLIDLWWAQAEANQVLPLDNRVLWALTHPKPDRRRPRERFRYFPGGAQVPESVAVNVRNRSHALIVRVEVDEGGCDGVLLALGSALGGWSLHVLNGRLRYVHNLYGAQRHVIESRERLAAGQHVLEYEFLKDEGLGGEGILRCDGEEVGRGRVARFTPSGFNGVGAGLTCGYEWGPAVGTGYEAPFEFAGTILSALVETRGPVVRDPLAELEAILSEQ
ncbi:MAG: arylsulfatase [Acidobacteriota bacterium]|nr:arylsulfatase [Acidobacteriota bacterium]MDE3030352.1 arylsulfatase [Acidobacteriota bacterium]